MLHLLNLLAAISLLVWGTHIVRAGVLKVFGENLRRVLAERPGLSLLVHRNACTFLARCLRQTSLDLSFARELSRRHL